MSDLGTIRANVSRNLQDSSGSYTPADLNYFIGRAFNKYALKMIDSGQGYFQLPAYLGFSANVESISLSSLSPAFLQIARLWRVTTTCLIPMKPSEARFTISSTINSGTGDSYIPDYRMQGLNLILDPLPLATEVASTPPLLTTGLKLDYNYIPVAPTATSADGFTFDPNFPVVWEPLVELDATISAMESKDAIGGVSDIQTFRDDRATWEQRLEDSMDRFEYPDSVQYVGVDYNSLNSNW